LEKAEIIRCREAGRRRAELWALIVSVHKYTGQDWSHNEAERFCQRYPGDKELPTNTTYAGGVMGGGCVGGCGAGVREGVTGVRKGRGGGGECAGKGCVVVLCTYTATKISFMCSQKRNCAASVSQTHECGNPFLGILVSNFRCCVFAV
jgi:hypothetical protein